MKTTTAAGKKSEKSYRPKYANTYKGITTNVTDIKQMLRDENLERFMLALEDALADEKYDQGSLEEQKKYEKALAAVRKFTDKIKSKGISA